MTPPEGQGVLQKTCKKLNPYLTATTKKFLQKEIRTAIASEIRKLAMPMSKMMGEIKKAVMTPPIYVKTDSGGSADLVRERWEPWDAPACMRGGSGGSSSAAHTPFQERLRNPAARFDPLDRTGFGSVRDGFGSGRKALDRTGSGTKRLIRETPGSGRLLKKRK
jgi:hypothetical protein